MDADPRLPWGPGIFDVDNYADGMQFHAARPVVEMIRAREAEW
jgi:hypothetical protein